MRNQQHLTPVGPLGIRTGSIKFVTFADLDLHAREMYGLIELRAYELYQARGTHGHDWLDWFLAEREVQLPVPIEDRWEGDTYVVNADVPGFREDEIEIGCSEKQLIIGGTIARPTVRKAKWIHRAIDLPEGLDSKRLTAKLNNGRLEISVPRKAVSHKSS